jgi:hypothetical protein
MWSTSMVLSVAWLVVGASNWLRAEERRTRREEKAPTRMVLGTNS